MTAEELGLIRRIYEEALPMDGASQAAFIRRQCQGRGDLEAEVHRLIRAHGKVPAWLDQPVLGTSHASSIHEPPKLEGRVIGGYTLTRELGRGGMGTVYLAERSDGVFHRQAAIKLVLPPFNSAAIETRFQLEREILASLDHPNIARLLDAGTTAEGWPYFVMEYVEGKPIDLWCEGKKLNITQRIQLFRDVIQAVDYAHRHLVVHRDLKPANILVTNGGTVKLLDFGIAKLLVSPTLDESAATMTLAGMMTLFYASPEQVSGAPITTQSDVYSLGVVFYELLTGHRPYRLSAAASHEIARVIAEVDPARPSDVITQTEGVAGGDIGEMTPERISFSGEGDLKRLRNRLRGDLDAIVLKALRKEPDRRYGSVLSFAEDLDRHIERRPILAREAGVWERLTRSVMREPPLVAGISVISGLLWVGLATVVLQTREDIEAAARNPGTRLSFRSLWFFGYALCIFALPLSVYIARITHALSVLSTRRGKRQRAGALVGGLIWGLGITLTWRLAGAEGWWHSRIAGHADPLKLTSPPNVLIYCVLGGTVMWVLYMSGQRLGRRGTGIALVLLGLGTAAVQRIAFGYIIPALAFDGSAVSFLSTAGISAAAGWIGLTVMRWIGGADRERPARL